MIKNTVPVMKNSSKELNISKEKITELEVKALEFPKIKQREKKNP